MKVGILFVTRLKLTRAHHSLLTETAKENFSKQAVEFLDHHGTFEIKNYFINSGNEWSQMQETIDEINNNNFDVIMLWTCPGVDKMQHFNKDFKAFFTKGIEKSQARKLHYTNGWLSEINS